MCSKRKTSLHSHAKRGTDQNQLLKSCSHMGTLGGKRHSTPFVFFPYMKRSNRLELRGFDLVRADFFPLTTHNIWTRRKESLFFCVPPKVSRPMAIFRPCHRTIENAKRRVYKDKAVWTTGEKVPVARSKEKSRER